MGFPIQFARKSGDYDFVSPIVNFTGNAAVVAVGGISLGIIANVALKALGYNALATKIATAVPVTIGAIGLAGVVVGTVMFIGIAYSVGQALSRR